jgi:hypothetical protein
MDFRLWIIFSTVCFLGGGCAAPIRTFVADDRPSVDDPFRPQSESSHVVSDSHSAKAEANPVKPSVWSQWMGAFSKPPVTKPAERIPLPRTDLEMQEEGLALELGESDF